MMTPQQESAFPEPIVLRITKLAVARHLSVDQLRLVESECEDFARLIVNAMSPGMLKTNQGRLRPVQVAAKNFAGRHFQPNCVVDI
jgi:hypothetical protein